MAIWRGRLGLVAALLAVFLAATAQAKSNLTINYDFDSWESCGKASYEYLGLPIDEDVHPCILYDRKPADSGTNSSRSFTVTLVQVTPAATSCYSMRDGAVVSVDLLNALNGGRGVPVGFRKDYYLLFRLVSILAGNGEYDGYFDRHAKVLDVALEALKPQYIVGTCSFMSLAETEAAEKHQTMLLAQVGPPSYYTSGNPYIFGVHVSSDQYTLPAVRALGFSDAPKNQPIAVMYRTVSEFFYSTCQSAIDTLHQLGFTNVKELLFEPGDDHNGDGIQNQHDVEFLHALADQACPPQDDPTDTAAARRPAIFACFLAEQEHVFPRLVQNGCRPTSLWLTAATWGWATANPGENPYIHGGGQWHSAFSYSDDFYSSGQELLEQSQERFGYFGTYDFVVSYSIPMVFVEHLKSTYRVTDDPNPASDFGSPEGYEMLRRSMVILDATTLFGPVAFDDNQRNIGRSPAGTQWQPESAVPSENSTAQSRQHQSSIYQNFLVAPDFMAQAEIVMPAPSAQDCVAGQYVNQSLVRNTSSLLTQKCSMCPRNTITYQPNQLHECYACPQGTATQGQSGETQCYYQQDNLISTGVRIFGYCLVGITWCLGLCFLGWLVRWRDDIIAKIAQVPFMALICIGAIISSSTIIALSWQAGAGEETSAATTACRVAPFLYTIGWVLQYGSLTAKTFRLYKVTSQEIHSRVKVTLYSTSWIVALVLALDLAIVITWTVVRPLEYLRDITSISTRHEDHLVVISSYGRCSSPEGTSIWAFTGPIVVIHVLLMACTNWLLYKISYLEDRYQEHKYVALASAFVFEVLVIGLPVLFSVGDDSTAVFLVLTGIIALNDGGMLCFLFLPKINFQRKGLLPGVGVGESMRKDTYKKAITREIERHSSCPDLDNHSEFSGQSGVIGNRPMCRSTAESTAEMLAGDNKQRKSDPDLDSNNLRDLKHAILEERCRFLEQRTAELENELQNREREQDDEEKMLINGQQIGPSSDSELGL